MRRDERLDFLSPHRALYRARFTTRPVCASIPNITRIIGRTDHLDLIHGTSAFRFEMGFFRFSPGRAALGRSHGFLHRDPRILLPSFLDLACR